MSFFKHNLERDKKSETSRSERAEDGSSAENSKKKEESKNSPSIAGDKSTHGQASDKKSSKAETASKKPRKRKEKPHIGTSKERAISKDKKEDLSRKTEKMNSKERRDHEKKNERSHTQKPKVSETDRSVARRSKIPRGRKNTTSKNAISKGRQSRKRSRSPRPLSRSSKPRPPDRGPPQATNAASSSKSQHESCTDNTKNRESHFVDPMRETKDRHNAASMPLIKECSIQNYRDGHTDMSPPRIVRERSSPSAPFYQQLSLQSAFPADSSHDHGQEGHYLMGSSFGIGDYGGPQRSPSPRFSSEPLEREIETWPASYDDRAQIAPNIQLHFTAQEYAPFSPSELHPNYASRSPGPSYSRFTATEQSQSSSTERFYSRDRENQYVGSPSRGAVFGSSEGISRTGSPRPAQLDYEDQNRIVYGQRYSDFTQGGSVISRRKSISINDHFLPIYISLSRVYLCFQLNKRTKFPRNFWKSSIQSFKFFLLLT